MRRRWLVPLLGSVLLAVVAPACSRSSSCAASIATLPWVGTAIAKDGAIVTFVVEEHPGPAPDGMPPRPAIGAEVRVRYGNGTQRFVHVGQRYQVSSWGQADDALLSHVVTAEHACQGGTYRADGSAIDTGLFTRDGFRPWLLVPILGGAALVVAAVVGLWRRHRWNARFYGAGGQSVG